MTFRNGQRVVCVDANPSRWGDESGLVEGTIYTISGFADGEHGPGVLITEVPLPDEGEYYCFRSSRFRPVQERKKQTRIDVFTKLLDGSRQRERA